MRYWRYVFEHNMCMYFEPDVLIILCDVAELVNHFESCGIVG